MPKMQFEEDYNYNLRKNIGKKPVFTRCLIATGIVSTDKQAEYVLLGISAIAIIISAFIFFGMVNNNSGAKPSPAFIEQMRQAQINNR